MKDQIVTLLQEVLTKMGGSNIVPQVDRSDNPEHGDYSTNVAMVLAKQLKRPAMELANELKDNIIRHLKVSSTIQFDRVDIAPPGFVNLSLTNDTLGTSLTQALQTDDSFRVARKLEQKSHKKLKVMVEFADPNPFKEFHIGHLRNITLGESFSRILEAIGHEVRRVNYQGDIGMHVAKSVWGLQKMLSEEPKSKNAEINPREQAALLGNCYARGSKAYEENEKDKNEIIELNKKIYAQDQSVAPLWKKGRQWSLDYFNLLYKRVGTTFTRFYFESEVAPVGMQIVLEHLKDGVFEESEGAIIFRGEAVGLHTRVFVTKEKYATYEAKDLALAVLKFQEYSFDWSVIMTATEQSPYFAVMLAALNKIQPDLAAKTTHYAFGMVNLTEGKMSSRTGNVITADWLIDQAKGKIYSILQKSKSKYKKEDQDVIAEKAAVAAVKYAMLKVSPPSDIAFDIQKSVAFDGDSGPYLQYTYARARSVLRKAKIKSEDLSNVGNLTVTMNKEERAVARLIHYFPEIVAEAAQRFAPNMLCTYLFSLAQAFNLFYTEHPIVGNQFRLALTAATAQIIKEGLYLLGIESLEQM